MLKGVVSVEPGYAGGTKENPTYEEVSAGRTGHAEVIRIEYNPLQVSFRNLLTVFFATHDPTTMNRQGADEGTQYRSIILYTNDTQKREAEAFIKELNASSPEGTPIVTEVRLLDGADGTGKFYPAEQYHIDYYKNNPQNPYCQIVINPKLEKVQKQFAELLKNSDSA